MVITLRSALPLEIYKTATKSSCHASFPLVSYIFLHEGLILRLNPTIGCVLLYNSCVLWAYRVIHSVAVFIRVFILPLWLLISNLYYVITQAYVTSLYKHTQYQLRQLDSLSIVLCLVLLIFFFVMDKGCTKWLEILLIVTCLYCN